MKRFIYTMLLAAMLGGGYAIGSWQGARKVIPGNTSEKSPVVCLPELPLNGVKIARVQKTPHQRTVRLHGKVAVDPTRIYRINAAVDGRITRAMPFAPGSTVKTQDFLAAYYSPDVLQAGQALLFALNAKDRIISLQQSQKATSQTNALPHPNEVINGSYARQISVLDYTGQLAQHEITIKQNMDTLKYLGMGDLQLEEIVRSRKTRNDIDVTAPVDGVILTRNVSLGQGIMKGTELFRMADLSRIWILADLLENDTGYIPPGLKVRVSLIHEHKTTIATVSQAPTLFDGASRSLKVRLEAENLDLTLKPDMFVDIEFPVELPPTLMVPAQAVQDSGLKKTVYVHNGDGFFEPRTVETGWHWGNQVEIVNGLQAGEHIVISGNFLVDSESQMRGLAFGKAAPFHQDPACGKEVYSEPGQALDPRNIVCVKTF